MAVDLLHPASTRGCKGQDLVEYALLAGFVAVAVAAIIPYQVTGPISGIFNKLEYYMKTWGNG
ncbi:hypothetical protein IRI77_01355 [Paludibaculum fermentans]|uniref:Flp family type IVb pilin n=1 Tax=Paludibaculum fermentans TaxID=1473598 RepID=A0A7S7SPR7_PALFE|nr:hypothetical protein IRI77_01355 [Paludibaculum fermentans]